MWIFVRHLPTLLTENYLTLALAAFGRLLALAASLSAALAASLAASLGLLAALGRLSGILALARRLSALLSSASLLAAWDVLCSATYLDVVSATTLVDTRARVADLVLLHLACANT